MKNNLVTLVLSIFIFTAFSQPVMYNIHGGYDRPVTKEKLLHAGLISDFVEGYPVHWITDYVSVEISATCDGKEMKAPGYNNALTTSQKNLLASADMSSGIIVDVKYRYPNSATGKIENRNANMSLTVVPHTEAVFPGGEKKMKKYFQEKGIDEISESIANRSEQVRVSFIVNEDGKISNARLVELCKDAWMNQKILDAIKEMPAWKPAENSIGIKVKQDFEFKINDRGGC